MRHRHAQVLQAYYDGAKLKIHKSEFFLDLTGEKNTDGLLFLTRFSASSAFGNTTSEIKPAANWESPKLSEPACCKASQSLHLSWYPNARCLLVLLLSCISIFCFGFFAWPMDMVCKLESRKCECFRCNRNNFVSYKHMRTYSAIILLLLRRCA